MNKGYCLLYLSTVIWIKELKLALPHWTALYVSPVQPSILLTRLQFHFCPLNYCVVTGISSLTMTDHEVDHDQWRNESIHMVSMPWGRIGQRAGSAVCEVGAPVRHHVLCLPLSSRPLSPRWLPSEYPYHGKMVPTSSRPTVCRLTSKRNKPYIFPVAPPQDLWLN